MIAPPLVALAVALAIALAVPRAIAGPRGAASPETLVARTAGSTLSRLWLSAPSGRRARALIRVPLGVPPRSAAGAVIAGGFEEGWRAAAEIDPGPTAALLSVDYPLSRDDRDVSGWEALRRAPELWRATHELSPLLEEAARHLGRHPAVDSTRVFVVGASLGAPFAIHAAANSKRIRGAAIFYGAADLAELVARNAWSLPRWLRPIAGRVLGWLYHDYEPARLVGRIAPRPVLLVNARGDERLSERQARRLYESARAPREQIWLDGRHLAGLDDREVLRELLATTVDWGLRVGLVRLVPQPPPAYGSRASPGSVRSDTGARKQPRSTSNSPRAP